MPKRVVGRKRHIAVDNDGRLLMVNLTTGDIADSTGAQEVMDALRKRWPWIKHLFADGAYDRRQMLDRAAYLDFVVEIVRSTDKGFAVPPRRWVVERSFCWLTRYRRLARDYEARLDVSEAMLYAGMSSSLLDASLTHESPNGLLERICVGHRLNRRPEARTHSGRDYLQRAGNLSSRGSSKLCCRAD